MNDVITLQGRELTPSDVEYIRRLLTENPTWSRRKLSIALCEAWDWRTATGQIKDMASRSLLVKLDDRGLIQLPERRQIPTNRMAPCQRQALLHDIRPIESKLKTLRPLKVLNVHPHKEAQPLYDFFLSTYHYLGYTSTVGENMKYLIQDRQDRPVACMLFGSSAWSAAGRDKVIGWDKVTRQRNLNLTTNNTRFLILPWVRVPHLASHLLGLISRRIQADWQQRYGHPVYCLETFVEIARFAGTCYQAANWQYVGETKGRSRNDRNNILTVPVKAIYLYPLTVDYRDKLQA